MARASGFAAACVLILAACVYVRAQEGGLERRSIWQGVFTGEQVQRGAASFNTSCARCHALDAQGVPARMSGEAFWNNWADDPLEIMFSRIQANMPANAPASLDPQVYADIVSFILSANGVPPGGTTELTPGAVASVQMVRRDGPRPVPAGALVTITGCLVQNGSAWWVEGGSEPTRVRALDNQLDLGRAQQVPSAGKAYELKFPLIPLTSMRGQQVVARGLLIRGPDALNVESVRSLGRPCA